MVQHANITISEESSTSLLMSTILNNLNQYFDYENLINDDVYNNNIPRATLKPWKYSYEVEDAENLHDTDNSDSEYSDAGSIRSWAWVD